MRCGTWKKRISDAMDGALTEARKARLERHLRDCAACRAYRDELTALGKGLAGLADPGLAPGAWEDWCRRLDQKLAAPKTTSQRTPFAARWRWAWGGASLAALAFIVTYFAVIRPRGTEEPAIVPFEDSAAQVLGEIGASPDLAESFNQEIQASIDEAALAPGEDAPVSFGDNPMFWEGLSDSDLGFIESELRNERGHGGKT